MAIYHSGDYTNKKPNWYWKRGLHDAQITKVECSNDESWLRFTIDPKGALYDDVSQITFLEYEIEDDVSLDARYYFWLEDILTYERKRFLLTLRLFTPKRKEIIVKIRFRDAQVEHAQP